MNRMKITAVAASCALAGVGAGALTSAGAASKPATAKAKPGKKQHKKAPIARMAGRAVHADLTVATKDGFKNVTVDRGFVTAVSGDQLTLSESTKKLKGKDVTLTIPADAVVRSKGKKIALGDVKAGQHVAVLALPKKTLMRVLAK